MATRTLFLCLISQLVFSGCLATRNFKDPLERPTARTAYTVPSRYVDPTVELLGQTPETLGIRLGAEVGIGRGQIGANLGHAVLGVVNVDAKYNLVDKKNWALGVQAGFVWIHPASLWLLPEDVQEPLSDLDIFSVPLEAVASFPVLDWASFHLGLGYIHGEMTGRIDSKKLFFDGSFGTRQIILRPSVYFYIAKRIAVLVGGKFLLWGRRRTSFTSYLELEEGVRGGLRSSEWLDMSFGEGSTLTVGVEAKFGKVTYLYGYLVYNGLLSRTDLIDSPVMPGIGIRWRI